jgi:Ca-activated chloride channel family protein
MKTCDQENRLTPFLLGDLPKAESDAFREHLTHCSSCQEESRELEPVLAALSKALARDAQIPTRLGPRRRAQLLHVRPVRSGGVIRWVARPRRWLAVAAGLAVLLGLVGSLVVVNLTGRSCSARLSAECASRSAACLVEAGAVDGDSAGGTFTALGRIVDAPAPATQGADPFAAPDKNGDGQREGWDKGVVGFKEAGGKGGSDSYKSVHPSASGPPVKIPSTRWMVNADEERKAADGHSMDATRGKTERSLQSAQEEKARNRDTDGDAVAWSFRKPITPAQTPPPPPPAPEGSASILDELNRSEDRKNMPVSGVRAGSARRYALLDSKAPPTAETPVPAEDAGRQGAENGTMNGRNLKVAGGTENKLVMKGIYAARTAGGRLSRKESVPGSPVVVPADPASPVSAAAAPKPAVRIGEPMDISEEEGRHGTPVERETAKKADRVSGLEPADKSASRARAKAPRPQAHAFNPFVLASENRFSTFSIAVNTASYTLTRQALRGGALPDPEVVRTEEIVNAFDYGDAAPDRATFRVYVEGAPSTFGSPGLTLLRIGVKGKRLGREEQRPAILTFLIDASGSMSQPDRIGRARTALRMLLDQLSPADRVQIVAFADKASVALPPTSASDKQAILAAFDRLQCNGSTNLEDGMRMAYQLAARAFRPGGENRVILISDGVANLGADNAQDILRQVDAFRKQGITCSVFGVGKGTYNDAILDELANKGNGVYRFLDSDEEVRRVFVDDLAATLNYIASDVKIQVEWATDAVRRYRQLGYERRALRTEDFRDDTVVAGQVGSGQCVTALYEIERAPVGRSQLLGTVRVRYRRVDTGAIEEIATPIPSESLASDLKRARPQMRLAACSAAFAERLRGSPYVIRPYADVARLLRPVALELSLDVRVKELLSLVEMAEGMSGGH